MISQQKLAQILAAFDAAGIVQAKQLTLEAWLYTLNEARPACDDVIAHTAARRILATRKSGFLTPAEFIEELDKLTSANRNTAETITPPEGLTPAQELTWRRAYASARSAGIDTVTARVEANHALGVTDTPPAAAATPEQVKELIKGITTHSGCLRD